MTQGAWAGSRDRKEHSFTTPTSRPNASLVKVESVFINIVAAEQNKPDKCEHFTIRGFVSDSREQNGKLHWPFSLDGDGAGSEEINSTIYPLHTPLFKSWRCQSCLNEIDATEAAVKKVSHNIFVKFSRHLKAKSSRSHRSLENVVSYLSEKLKKHSELGALCEGIESGTKLKQKQKKKQKQKLDSALQSNPSGLGDKEIHNAAKGLISYQHNFLTYIDEHQEELLRPPRTTTSTNFGIVDGSQRKGRHAAAAKLVKQQHDDSVGTGRRKNKAKKVRLLNEIFAKDGKGAQSATTKGFHTDESAKASCTGPQSLLKNQFDNMRCQAGQKRNINCQEEHRKWSQMHYVDNVDGNDERRKAQGLNSAFANAMHMPPNDAQSDAIIEHADKIVFGREQRANGHKNYPDKSQKTNNDSCGRQGRLSTCQPFHGRVTDSLHNNLPHSQIGGKSNDAMHKVHRGANMLAPSDNGKGLEGNNVTQKLMETIQIGHQTQYFQPMEDGNSRRRHYYFADSCVGARKGNGDWIPATGNGRYDTAVYMGESSTARKSFVDKNIHQGSNSISVLKRPNQGPCGGNKKPKHSGRTEGGPAVVHQTELMLRNSSEKMCGMLENPGNALCEMRGNMMQEVVGTSDDIPMEIVELMAKNQYERHLHEVEDKCYVQQSGSYPKNDLVGSTTNMPPSDVSQGPLYEKPHLPNERIILENNSGICRISNGKPDGHITQRPSTGRTHRPLLSSQRDMSVVLQFPAVGSSKTDIFPVPNCKYDMNKLASEQRVPTRSQAQFELWQPTSQQSDKTGRAWPVVPPNNQVHMPSVLQGNALQSFYVGEASKCSSYVGEGRDFVNLAVTGKKTNNFQSEASHTSRPNRVDSGPQVMGSLDPYANEAIPAMHLLSLMNGRPQSSTPTNMDSVVNRKTFDRSFTNDHLAKELSGNSFDVGKSSHKLKQPSLYRYHKNHQSDASCQCSPPVPTFSSAVASLHGDFGDKRGVQPSSHHQERAFLNVNPGGSRLPSENESIKYQKYPLISTVGLEFQPLIPARQLTNHIVSPLWSVPGSSDLRINGNFYRYRSSVDHEYYDTLNKRTEHGVCCLNRNPMEFSTPGPGNEFMIGPEDLKLRKAYLTNDTGPMARNSFKQLGFIKYAAPNNRR